MCTGACKGNGALVEALYDEIERLKGQAMRADWGAERVEATVSIMRRLGIDCLKYGDMEIALGPAPVSEADLAPVLATDPVQAQSSTSGGGIPPRNSPIWWSTPHYSTSAPKEGE